MENREKDFDPLCEDMDELDKQLKNTNNHVQKYEGSVLPDIVQKACGVKFELSEETFQQLSELLKSEKFVINEDQDSLISLKAEMEGKFKDIMNCIKFETMKIITSTTDRERLAQCSKVLTNVSALSKLAVQENKDTGNSFQKNNVNGELAVNNIENGNFKHMENKVQEEDDNSTDVTEVIIHEKEPEINSKEVSALNKFALQENKDTGNNFEESNVIFEIMENNIRDENTEKAIEVIVSKMSSPALTEDDNNSDDSVYIMEEIKNVRPEESLSPDIDDINGYTEKATDELEIPIEYTQPSTSYSGPIFKNKKIPHNHTCSYIERKQARKYRNKYIPYEVKKEGATKKREHVRLQEECRGLRIVPPINGNSFKSHSYQWPNDSGQYRTREEREYFDYERTCRYETKMKLLEEERSITSERRKRKYHSDRYGNVVKRNKYEGDEEVDKFRLDRLLKTATKLSTAALLQLIMPRLETIKLETDDDIRMWEKLGHKVLDLVMDAKFKSMNNGRQ